MISVVILANKSSDVSVRTRKSLSFAKEILYIPVYGDFAAARNEGMYRAKYTWVLFIDSDEVVTDKLAKQIIQVQDLKGNTPEVFYIRRRDYFWGKEMKYGETQSAREQGIIRLVKKNTGKWQGAVHEVFVSNAGSGRLTGFIDHYPHPTISSFLASINEYSTIRAQELHSKGARTNVFQILLFPFGKFWYTYLFKLGFLDGPAGFVYSFMMSFHSFLVRSKLFLKTEKI